MNAKRNLTDPARALTEDDLERGLKQPVAEAIEIPEHFGPVGVLVDDLKVKRFAFTQDDYGGWYFGESPFGYRIGHAALLANDLLQLFTLRYAASQVVGLHTEEELWFERPVRVGEVVRLEGSYTEAFERRGQGCVVLEADARDSEGRVLLRHRGIEIMRTVPGTIAGRSSAETSGGRRVTGEVDESLAAIEVAGALADAVPGAALVPLAKEITQEQMSVFSRCGEYVRNIHNDLQIARAGGLRVPIVQGQQQVCHLAEILTRVFGARWFTGGWLRCKFLRPVDGFEVISVGGVVREVERDGDDAVVHLDVWIRKPDGSLATVGWAACRWRAP